MKWWIREISVPLSLVSICSFESGICFCGPRVYVFPCGGKILATLCRGILATLRVRAWANLHSMVFQGGRSIGVISYVSRWGCCMCGTIWLGTVYFRVLEGVSWLILGYGPNQSVCSTRCAR